MELYEALKSGTDATELENAFYEELKRAQKRIAMEQEEQEKERLAAEEEEEKKKKEAKEALLNESREKLADAIYNYACSLVEDKDIKYIDAVDINNQLLDFEKETLSLLSISKKLEKAFEEIKSSNKKPAHKKVISKSRDNDDDVISNFLKGIC